MSNASKKRKCCNIIESSTAFTCMLYSGLEEWYDDALEFGTSAFLAGELDTSRHYQGFCALVGLTCVKTKESVLTELFHLIKNSGGLLKLNNISRNEMTPLILALKAKNYIVAKLIVEQSECDVNVTVPATGQNALMTALNNGCHDDVDKLAICGILLAKPELDLDMKDLNGDTVEDIINRLHNKDLQKLFPQAKMMNKMYRTSFKQILQLTLAHSLIFCDRSIPRPLIQIVQNYIFRNE